MTHLKAPGQAALTRRDEALLVTLTQRVKLLSLDQAQRLFWPAAGAQTARRRLRRLTRAGWLEARPLILAQTRPLTRPLVVWQSGEKAPDLTPLPRLVRAACEPDLRSVVVFVATARAARHFGGQQRYARPSEAGHDWMLAELYVRFCVERPADASVWMGEGVLAGHSGARGVLPDALLEGCPLPRSKSSASRTPPKNSPRCTSTAAAWAGGTSCGRPRPRQTLVP